jgi:hypothetical protein
MHISPLLLSTTLKRDGHGSVFFCPDIHWNGVCAWAQGELDTCSPMIFAREDNMDGDMGNKVSSIGPDLGAKCIFFNEADCNGISITLTYPGLAELPAAFNDNVKSWKCVSH